MYKKHDIMSRIVYIVLPCLCFMVVWYYASVPRQDAHDGRAEAISDNRRLYPSRCQRHGSGYLATPGKRPGAA